MKELTTPVAWTGPTVVLVGWIPVSHDDELLSSVLFASSKHNFVFNTIRSQSAFSLPWPRGSAAASDWSSISGGPARGAPGAH